MRKTEQQLALVVGTIVMDGLTICGAWLLAFWLRFTVQVIALRPGLEVPPFNEYLRVLPPALILWWALFALAGLYDRRPFRLGIVAKIARMSTVGIVLMAAWAFFYRSFEYSRAVALLAWALTVLLPSLGRVILWSIQQALHRRGFGVSNVVIVGAGKLGRMVGERLAGDPLRSYNLVGYLDDAVSGADGGARILGTTRELEQVILREEVDEVVLTLPFRARQRILDLADICESRYVKAHVIPDFYELLTKNVQVETVTGIPMLGFKESPLSGWKVALKQVFDLVGASLLLVVLSPVLLLVAALVALTSRGPVLYRQERVGRDGKTFQMLKFRTMRANAEATTGPVWASDGDTRRTPLGRVLRRFSVDEFPQLFNVLRGEMSLVGPRPERPVFVKAFERQIQEYFRRHKVKAGVTGWAQVNGLRGNTSIEGRTKLDLYYVEHWSLGFDVRILVHTVFQALRGTNAY